MNYRFTSNQLPQLGSWVGFERVWDELERVAERNVKAVGYPPYNVKKVDDSHYVIEMAVAGFAKTDIDITMTENQLVIKGEMKPDPTAEYTHKGIAERNFERTFTLANSVIVKNASMLNGMLKVFLEQIIPEEKKPRKIEVSEADTPDLKTIVDTKQYLAE